MPLEKSIIFLNHRNGFWNVMFCGVCFSFLKKSLESYSYLLKLGGDILAATTASIYPGFAEAVSEPEIYNLPFNKGLYSRDVRCSHVP
jgi:hypothetical protein